MREEEERSDMREESSGASAWEDRVMTELVLGIGSCLRILRVLGIAFSSLLSIGYCFFFHFEYWVSVIAFSGLMG